MPHLLNINTEGQRVTLLKGLHNISIIGGFGTELNGFSITFKNLESGEKTESKRTLWRVQSYHNGRRMKRVFNVDIPNNGEYEIILKNADKLFIRRSNLFLASIVARRIPTEKLRILIK